MSGQIRKGFKLSKLDTYLPHVFAEEGGFVDHPKDPGGATNMGITIGTLSGYLGRKATVADVKNLSRVTAAKIYRVNYWDKIHGEELPAGVDYAVLDFAVNSGPARAAKFLQKIVGVNADGIIGVQTIRAVNAMDPIKIINALCDNRLAWLKGLKAWPNFGKGWGARVARVRKKAIEYAKGATLVVASTLSTPQPQKATQDQTSVTAMLKTPEGIAAGTAAAGATGSLLSSVAGDPFLSGAFSFVIVLAALALFIFFLKRIRSE